MAIQELQNRAQASDATTEFMIESGKLYADYGSTLGKNAVDGLPKFQKDMEELRNRVGGGVGNPMVRKMYDAETKNTMGRTLFSAAGHSKNQLRQWTAKSAEARLSAIGDQALANPTDDLSFQAGLKKTREEVEVLSGEAGFDKDQFDQELATRTSSLWEKRIAGLAKDKPFLADKMLSEAVSRGDIRGESIAKITNLVNQSRNTIGAREVSRDTNSGADFATGRSPVDVRSARYAVGKFESGGNYEALGPEVFRRDGTSRGRALGKYQVMPENLPGWLKEAGLDPMTPQEFLKNSKAQDAVFDTIFGGYMKKTGSFADAASMWHSGVDLATAKAQGRRDVNISTENYVRNVSSILGQNAPLADRETRARERAKTLSTDPLFEDYVVQRVHADYNLQQSTKRNDEYLNRQTVESGMVGLIGKGQLPTSVEELKALGPEVGMAWDNLEPSKQRAYLGVMAKNAKGETALTEEGLSRWKELKGMAQADPKAFMDVDILEESLPIATKKELIGLQISKKGKAEGDPRVLHAVSLLKPQMEAAGLVNNAVGNNRKDYYEFMGALQDQLTQYQEDNKKPADAKVINEIGSRLLQQKGSPKFWYGTDQMFKLPVPDKDAERIKALPAWTQLGITPTDDQIRRVYTREEYQRLYGGTAKTEKPAATGLSPPISR